MGWIKKSETTASYLSSHNIIPSILLLQENVQVIRKIENSVSLDVILKKMKQKDWILIEIQEKTDGDFGLFKQIFSAILFEIMQGDGNCTSEHQTDFYKSDANSQN